MLKGHPSNLPQPLAGVAPLFKKEGSLYIHVLKMLLSEHLPVGREKIAMKDDRFLYRTMCSEDKMTRRKPCAIIVLELKERERNFRCLKSLDFMGL